MAKDSQKDGGGKDRACRLTNQKFTMVQAYGYLSPPLYAGKAAISASYERMFLETAPSGQNLALDTLGLMSRLGREPKFGIVELKTAPPSISDPAFVSHVHRVLVFPNQPHAGAPAYGKGSGCLPGTLVAIISSITSARQARPN